MSDKLKALAEKVVDAVFSAGGASTIDRVGAAPHFTTCVHDLKTHWVSIDEALSLAFECAKRAAAVVPHARRSRGRDRPNVQRRRAAGET
jgi:hypothetical protein